MGKLHRVISVDEDDEHYALVRSALDGLPVDLLRASTGNEALTVIRQSRPELILLDVNLGGATGWNLLDTFRGMEKEMAGVKVLVLVLFPHSSVPHRIIARLREVGDHLTKPIEPDELRGKVSLMLGVAA